MIKICHMVNQMDVGGLERVLVNIINNTQDTFSHSIISVNTPSTDFLKSVTGNVEILSFDNLGISSRGRNPLLLSRFLIDNSIDVLHSRNPSLFLESFFAALIAPRCKLVHSYHGQGGMPSLIGKIALKTACRLVKGKRKCTYFTLTNKMAGEMSMIYSLPKRIIKIISNGIDTSRFRPCSGIHERELLRNKYGLRNDDFVLGFVGRLTKIKNIPQLFSLFYKFKKATCSKSVLVVVGDGEEKANLCNLASSMGLTSDICFLGEIETTEEVYRTFDVYSQLSISEGCSNTLLESMASGLPCVVTAVGGNVDIINNGVDGILSSPIIDSDQLNAIISLYNDSNLRESLAKSARKKIDKLWNMGIMIKQYEALYTGLVEDAR